MQAVQRDPVWQAGEPFRRPLDLADAGQEGEQIALPLLRQCTANGAGHRVLDPHVRRPADMAQLDGEAAPLALDHGCAVHQGSEARAIERGRHGENAQVLAQSRLRVEGQRKAEIALQTALMHFIEQHRRHARQFRIGLNAAAENPLRHDENACDGRLPAFQPRRVANKLAGLLPRQLRHPLRRRPRRQPARRKQPDLSARHPRLIKQGRRNAGRLARPRRRHKHRPRPGAQRSQQIGQNGVDGQSHCIAPTACASPVEFHSWGTHRI